MPKSKTPLQLSASRDIPFDHLVLSQSNVRRIKAGVSIEELAEDIARRTLLQSLTVRPVFDEAGAETGLFEIPAGGRRYRALERLVQQKRLAKDAPVPCVIRYGGLAEEDSLAENLQRAPLHPLDQFRAFQALREKGQGEEEIAAAFFVSVGVVRQRLRLAAVSPKLLEIYAEDGLSLDQLMAFTVNPDHERQAQVFERLGQSYDMTPYVIRRLLTEDGVRAGDRRAQFVGVDAYVDAGGSVLNDLFQDDQGGWLQDAALLERLVAEKLDREAEAILAEGWKWVEASVDFPYGHTHGLRQIVGQQPELTDGQQAARDALQAEFEQLERAHADLDELPEPVDLRLAELETAVEAIDARPQIFADDDRAIAGAFVSLDSSGRLQVARGYVRPEDETPAPEDEPSVADGGDPLAGDQAAGRHAGDPAADPGPDEDDQLRPLSDRLVAELTAHRTLALRNALAERPDVAWLAMLQVLVLKLFYRYAAASSLEVEVKCVGFSAQPPGFSETASARTAEAAHQRWLAQLPKEPDELWETLQGFDADRREALFAHCVGLSLNAVTDHVNRRPKAIAHADRIAEAVGLDMAEAGWTPSADSFLGRVAKPRILQAVGEARGEAEAARIAHLKKGEMVQQAQAMLAGTGWLPEPLRTPGRPWGRAAEAEANLAADRSGEPCAEADPAAPGPNAAEAAA